MEDNLAFINAETNLDFALFAGVANVAELGTWEMVVNRMMD